MKIRCDLGLHRETCKLWRGSLPICGRIDPDIIAHADVKTLSRCEEIGVLIRNGHAAASIHVEVSQFPETREEFYESICALHGMIFAEGVPEIAGRYRVPGEEVHFGGEGLHRITGAPAEFIDARIDALYDRVFQRANFAGGREEVATLCALFLEEFFRIHPFNDGNGRVGRLVIQWACVRWSRFRFNRFTTSAKSRRRYQSALEFAHRYVPGSVHPHAGLRSNPYVHLARWLLKHLEETPPDLGLEAEPPHGSGPARQDT